jgi:hypothetical protein
MKTQVDRTQRKQNQTINNYKEDITQKSYPLPQMSY